MPFVDRLKTEKLRAREEELKAQLRKSASDAVNSVASKLRGLVDQAADRAYSLVQDHKLSARQAVRAAVRAIMGIVHRRKQ